MTTLAQPHSPAFLKRRKALLVLPFLILPFAVCLFVALGGGSAAQGLFTASFAGHMGLNTELPKAIPDKKTATMNKLAYYEKAAEDSLKKRELVRRDPYLSNIGVGMNHPPPLKGSLPVEDPKAKELLQKLDLLRQSLKQPSLHSSTTVPPVYPTALPYPARTTMPISPPGRENALLLRMQQLVQSGRQADTAAADPQLDRLNALLDKVIKIQQPVIKPASIPEASVSIDTAGKLSSNMGAAAVAIPAVVQEDQTLYNGTTVALRIMDSVTVNGILLPADQLVYGQVSITNDRMQVHINSVRRDSSLYPVNLQVYDMDGLPGIHVPDELSREVAKQSADQGVGSLNIASFDPSLSAQAANAGIQAAKSLLSHKVRLVRVSVRAGYQVLLKSNKAGTSMIRNSGARAAFLPDSAVAAPADLVPFLHKTTRAERMAVTLQGIYLDHGLLWMSVAVHNKSAIDYTPEYTRWYTRDRKVTRRTAIQEITFSPVSKDIPTVIPGDSARTCLIGFHPFTLEKDKELVLQIGERNGGRQLALVISHRELLKARKL